MTTQSARIAAAFFALHGLFYAGIWCIFLFAGNTPSTSWLSNLGSALFTGPPADRIYFWSIAGLLITSAALCGAYAALAVRWLRLLLAISIIYILWALVVLKFPWGLVVIIPLPWCIGAWRRARQ